MRRLETHEPAEVMLHKPRTSCFSPHCIVAALLPDRYPSCINVGRGYHAVQMSTLRWLANALSQYAKRPEASRVAILNSDNQLVLSQELKDSVHVVLRAVGIIERAIASPSPNCGFFECVLVPVLCGISFRGDEDDMITFLQELERNSSFLQETRRHVLTLGIKSAVTKYLLQFERDNLPRNARTAITRTLTRTRISYGGAPFIAGFGLAMILQAWAELKMDLYNVLCIPAHRWR